MRDIKSDFEERGRTYFPKIDFLKFSEIEKIAIQNDIKQDFDDAYEGIKKLPKAAQMGVYLAYVYYLELFKKIKNAPATTIMHERIRVGDTKKMSLLCAAYIKFQLTSL